jgi:branched-chain amino acid transport system ATP-binding protein
MTEALLELRAVTRRFAGVNAADGVDLRIASGEIHGLIGPNGAGKTTLIQLIAGALRPDAGSIVFAGGDLTRLPEHRRVRLGLVRSFQISSVFQRLSLLEQFALAVQLHSAGALSPWQPAERTGFDAAEGLLTQLGLDKQANRPAAALAYGEQRLVEVGLALATRPRLLLLDEPLSGLSRDESRRMVATITTLRERCTVLLVEHDMDAVFRLATQISVLVAGRVVATGTPEAVRADPSVRRAYLGEGAVAAK